MTVHVAIVGAGPGGMSAAIEAQRRGARVTLIDEAAKPGGQIFRQSATGHELPLGLPGEQKRKKALLSRFRALLDGIDYRPNCTAYALFEGPELHLSDQHESEVLKPDVVLLATGVCERAVPFPGWTLPGVVFAGGAQALVKSQGLKIGERVVLAGAGPLPIAVAAQLVQAGVQVVAVALLFPLHRMLFQPWALWAGRSIMKEGWQYLNTLRHNNVEVLSMMVPVRADGSHHIESIQMIRHDGTGRPLAGTEKRIGCDVLALNYGFTANSELANMAGAQVEYSPGRGGWLPVTDVFCRTGVNGVLVAGDGAGLRGSWVAEAEGRIAGAVAACFHDAAKTGQLEQELEEEFGLRRRHETFQQAVQQSLRLPSGVWGWADDDTVVCRCECVPLRRIRQAVAQGHTTMNGIKRNTRSGMGWCGGRMCMQNVAAYAGAGRLHADLQPMTPRPLARPVSLTSLKNHRAP